MTPAPTPQPGHDHGAAGFCTDHGQAPDERVETVARVLAEALLDHQPGDGYPWDDRHDERRVACWCGDLTPSEYFGWRLREWHRKHVAAHQAAAVVAALDTEEGR